MGGVGKIGLGPKLVPLSMDVLFVVGGTSIHVLSSQTRSIWIWMGCVLAVSDHGGYKY